MHKKQRLFSLSLLLLAGLGLLACGGGEPEEVVAHDPTEWAWLQQTKAELTAKREELSELKAKIAGDVEEAAEEAAEAEEMTAEEMQAKADALAAEIDTKLEEFLNRLVDFINKGIDADAEGTEIHAQALAMKSAEDIIVAHEYIEKGGDYSRAITIMQTALKIDPDNPVLQEAIAAAETNQYMSEERFAQVKKGMGKAEVRKLLGTVKRSNERDYPERKTQAWFYKKEDGGAAGVFFTEKKGEWEVYNTDYNAVKPPTVGGDGEEESEG